MENKWNELTIICQYDLWPRLEEFLYEKDLYSFELIDPRMENIDNDSNRWDFIEEDIFKDAFDGITVKLYSSDDDALDLKEISKEIENKKLGKTYLELIDDQDWRNNWKAFYEVQEIGPKVVIKPSWESYDNKEDKVVIELDPGMAFGTGGHETTRMCLELLQKYLKADDKILDIGCGSGILSVAGKLLGASKVIGADLDEKAVEISKKNADHNKADVDFKTSNLFSEIDSKGDLIIANIVAEIIVVLIDQVRDYLEADGTLICSGIIEEKSALVEEALEKNGFELVEKMTENEWVALVARDKHA
ncbi:50S ribosomal protein L11 methyltransferase [Neofamilia massiliensis]|uniref:50S ribosomal protein L11 methyltransferase n=1 Tax=Neofamilia massiliensis TaxID=1673724 RepID=UPI0006BB7FBD|nr:50S ribosomal protein L11 methyltransferase [Neofamilia massiliensis]